MATTTRFNNMLNEAIDYDLLWEETKKRNYLLQNTKTDNTWSEGPLIIPFKGGKSSSFRYGKLTAQSDISEHTMVRGQVDSAKEIWGTMKWNQRDIVKHEGGRAKFNERGFLSNLKGQVDEFIDDMKDCVSLNLLVGDHFARLTSDANANDGTIVVDRPERFQLDQKVGVKDDDTAVVTGYVDSIDINSKTIVLTTTRGGATAVDFSASTMQTSQDAKCYVDGADVSTDTFTSLRDQLLSLANGGSANLFGKSKLAYPYLQAINVDGSGINATNILSKVFDGWTTINTLGKGHATDAIVSYKHLGSIMKQLETNSGGFRHVSTKATVYGYTEIIVVGVKGQLKIVGVHEMDDDLIFYMDWRSVKLHSNGYFKKNVDPDGNNYHKVREEDGYFYICDISFFGEFAVNRPSHCGVMYGIPSY